MTNVFRCTRCRRTFIEEEFEKHPCTPSLAGVREIEFDYYFFTKNKANQEMIMIKGMDGVLYGFVKREMKPSDKVPLFPSDDFLQGDKSKGTHPPCFSGESFRRMVV